MESPTRRTHNRPVVLWSNNAVTCTSLTHGDNTEICLVVVGVTVHREFFTDAESAAQFAIAKMHVYNPHWRS
jgi:hypothetical protein